MHQHIRIGMAIKAFRMGNLNATKDKASAFNQGVDVIADANVNH